MALLQVNPDVNKKIVDFFRAVFADGALDRKTKELIALQSHRWKRNPIKPDGISVPVVGMIAG